MNTTKKDNMKANAAAAASSTVGAAIGIVGGSMISEEIQAAEVQAEPVIPEDTDDSNTGSTDDVQVIDTDGAQPAAHQPAAQTHQPAAGEEPSPATCGEPNPNPMPAAEGNDIQVLDYQTVHDGNGNTMDAALVSVDGTQAVIVDGDRDGIADAVISDVNGDGTITDNEVFDISDQNLHMQDLQAAAGHGADPGESYVAQNTGEPDYINDANVDDYMA